jgi:cell division protein FtsW
MYNLTPLRRETSPPVPYDRWLVIIVLTLLSMGLLMVASAAIMVSDIQLHQPLYYFYRQLVFVFAGVIFGSIVVQFDVAVWQKIGSILLVGTIFLLVLVLVPGIGRSVNGSTRWISLGFFGVQVSELAKFASVIFIAGYIVRRQGELQTNLMGFLKPIGILAIIGALLLKEPDFGATAVIFATALGMMFMGGVRIRHFLVLFAVVASALMVLAISEPYRLHRLTSFLNPWAHPFSSGYQLTQSLIAFGRGGWFGVGLGKSIQKLFYLPEAHTDFLFAVIGEELGLLGIIGVLMLFTLFVLRVFSIGRVAQQVGQHFSGFLAYGLGLWFAIQFCVSLGVNTGILPTKGLTLPLISYGGSSMIITCVAIALILRIDYENRMMAMGLK